MMTFKKYVYIMLLAILGTAMTTGCSDDKVSLALDGQCMLKALTLDDLQAEIDKVSQTATVYVPEGASANDMELTDLTISDVLQHLLRRVHTSTWVLHAASV